VRAGAKVPPFFALSSEAYNDFIDYNSIRPLIDRIGKARGLEEVLRLAEEIRSSMLSGSFPQRLERELLSVFSELRSRWGSVAVRSSATREDASAASFAGQFETYLGVRGDDELLQSVMGCYASLYNDRAVTYRYRMGLPQDDVQMAIVVQGLVKARSAGVMFTVNPVNGDPSVIAIESSWGLGEAVVKGEVIPDRYLINKVTLEVLKIRRLAEQACKIRSPRRRTGHQGRDVREVRGAELGKGGGARAGQDGEVSGGTFRTTSGRGVGCWCRIGW